MGPASSPLVGTWKLRAFTRVDAETGQESTPFGMSPGGYLNYSPDGRMMVILLGDNRSAPKDLVPTDQEMIGLFKSMAAYAGTYTIDGNQVIHSIDASWNQAWTGIQQTRFFKMDDRILTLTGRGGLGGRTVVSTAVWEKM